MQITNKVGSGLAKSEWLRTNLFTRESSSSYLHSEGRIVLEGITYAIRVSWLSVFDEKKISNEFTKVFPCYSEIENLKTKKERTIRGSKILPKLPMRVFESVRWKVKGTRRLMYDVHGGGGGKSNRIDVLYNLVLVQSLQKSTSMTKTSRARASVYVHTWCIVRHDGVCMYAEPIVRAYK